MAKAKNKKRISSDRVHLKKQEKKRNPFEVHVNKEKLKVIGRKQKNEKGLPGVSRAKAIEKRKATLLEEYKVRNKDNQFIDQRIGEKNHMDSEEKALARFAAVKMKAHNKKNIFNLADDEILTHKGHTLNEIEKFDDPRSDDDEFSDSEKKQGHLESSFVKEAHFGGGLFKNTGKEGAMTHKDLINQLIIESKKRKAEKQKLKEATLELTEKLDTEWKDLIPLVNQSAQNKDEFKKQSLDDYDKVMRELKFEKRGTVSDRLKTELELAKEEKENLEQLEQDRVKRMNNTEENPKQYHRSADDLDDGFVFDDEDVEQNILSYNSEGEANVKVQASINGCIITGDSKVENDEDKADNVGEQTSDEELETDSEDNFSDLKEEDTESEIEEETEEPDNVEKDVVAANTQNSKRVMVANHKIQINNTESTDFEDNFSGRKEEETESEIEEETEEPDNVENGVVAANTQNSKRVMVANHEIQINNTGPTDSEDNFSDRKEEDTESEIEEEAEEPDNVENEANDVIAANTQNSKKVIVANRKILINNAELTGVNTNIVENDMVSDNEKVLSENEYIPFTFNMPQSYEDLLKNLEIYSGHQDIVIQRIVKCNHPSLSEKNKDKLGLLFAYILQYLNDLFVETLDKSTIKKHFDIFQRLVPQIYELAKLDPKNAHTSLLEVIKEKFEEYKKKPTTYPGIEVLVFFKLVSILFPTSDFRHQIVTPCYIFMELILTKCKVTDRKDIAYGLFVSALILEYSALSKRFLPAVINYLSGLLHMTVPKTGVKLMKIPPPFKSTCTHLVLIENYNLESFESMKLKSADFCKTKITGEYQVRALYNVLKLLEQFLENYKLLPSHVEIFEKALKYLELIPCNNYPKNVQNELQKFIELLTKCREDRRLDYLVMESSKPKALRLYEPNIQVIYDGRQHKKQSREKALQSKLLHKLKREKKGALREIRRDNTFLGRVKINNQIKSDMERREKVKRIYSEAAMQQSELNEMDRKKKRKR